MTEPRVRVPLDGWNADERRRLLSLAAGALLDIRWEGDEAVLVDAADEERVRGLAASIRADTPESALGSPPESTPESSATTATTATTPAAASAAMWAIDPTGRHEYRYWSGTVWTAHVADQGVQRADPLTEPPPSGPPIPPPPVTAQWAAAPGVRAPPAWGTASGHTVARFDPTAVMGRRYGAFFIDVAISLAVFTVVFFAFATQRSVPETLRLPECHLGSNGTDNVECDNRVIVQLGDTVYEADALPTIGIDVVFTLLYFGILEGAAGATLGKRATGLRVVREDGSVQGVRKSLLRWLLFTVDGPLSLFLCGIITTSTSRGHKRLGDMAAGTYVVANESVGSPVRP